jgi:hypothetical protein
MRHSLSKLLVLGLAVIAAPLIVVTATATPAAAATQVAFDCAGVRSGTYIVPAGVTALRVHAAGAKGAAGAGTAVGTYAGGSGGEGAVVDAVVPVSAGQSLAVQAGCGQSGAHQGGQRGGAGTHGGCAGTSGDAGSGGGSSAVRSSGTSLVEAAGGGGGGAAGCYGAGGAGGAGSQSGAAGAGGAAGGSTTLAGATGADGGSNGGGGGGGGGGCLYGAGGSGGDSGGGGGGGGSSCVADGATAAYAGAGNNGDGLVTIDPLGIAVITTRSLLDSNGTGREDAGDHLDYAVELTNLGSLTLTDASLAMALVDPAGVTLPTECVPALGALAPGASASCTASYELLTTDFDRGRVWVTATAVGRPPALPDGTPSPLVQASATTPTTLTDIGSVSVDNSVASVSNTNGNGVTGDPGDLINYSVVATNTGNSTLAGLTVTETATGAASTAVVLACTPALPASLPPGAAVTCTGSHQITVADAATASASVSASASAAGTSRAGEGSSVSGSDPAGPTALVSPPGISTSSLPSGAVGTAYTASVSATGVPAPTFSATGLPAGLAINPTTGTISGTPTVGGTFTVHVTAANSAGQVTVDLPLTIAKAVSSTSVALTGDSVIATVTSPVTGVGSPSGIVTFSHDGTILGTAPLDSSGHAALPYDDGQGGFAAAYNGDSTFLPSSGSTARTNPQVSAAVTGPPGSAGWRRGPVTVTFTCTAGSAPLTAPCPAPVVLAVDGVTPVVSRTVSATDGGIATVNVGPIAVDQTAPTVRITHGPGDRGQPPATMGCQASDLTSGLASCDVSRVIARSVVTDTAVATDAAGNSATTSERYQVRQFSIVGARLRHGRYVLRVGRAYLARAYVSSEGAPSYLPPRPAGAPLGKQPVAMEGLGEGIWGHVFAATPAMLAGAKHRNLVIGILVAGKVHRLKVRLVG